MAQDPRWYYTLPYTGAMSLEEAKNFEIEKRAMWRRVIYDARRSRLPGLKWETRGDAKVCPECQKMEGRIFSLEEYRRVESKDHAHRLPLQPGFRPRITMITVANVLLARPSLMTRAIGLLSGGLDSMLAARLIKDQKIDVLGVAFVTPFFGPEKARQAAEQLQLPLQVLDITQPHWAMLRRPRYGYGKGLNPCIDCHALMLHEAGKTHGAHRRRFFIHRGSVGAAALFPDQSPPSGRWKKPPGVWI